MSHLAEKRNPKRMNAGSEFNPFRINRINPICLEIDLKTNSDELIGDSGPQGISD